MKIFPDKRLIALSLIMTIVPVSNVYPTPQPSNGSVDIALIAMLLSGLIVTSAIAGGLFWNTFCKRNHPSIQEVFHHLPNRVNSNIRIKDYWLFFYKSNERTVQLHIDSGGKTHDSSLEINNEGKLNREFAGVFETKTGSLVHYKSENAKCGFNCESKNKGCWCQVEARKAAMARQMDLIAKARIRAVGAR